MVETNRMRVTILSLGIWCLLISAMADSGFASEAKETFHPKRYYLRKDYLNFKPESACVYFFDDNTVPESTCSSLFLSGSARLSPASGEAKSEEPHASVSDSVYYGLFPIRDSKFSDKALVLVVYFAEGYAVHSPPISIVNAESVLESSSVDSLAKNMIKIERERLEVMDQTRQVEYDMAEFMARIGTYKEGARLLQLNKEKEELLQQISELEYNQGRFTELIASSRGKNSPIQQANQLRKRDLALAVKQVVENSVR